jgi:hypothetical protein
LLSPSARVCLPIIGEVKIRACAVLALPSTTGVAMRGSALVPLREHDRLSRLLSGESDGDYRTLAEYLRKRAKRRREAA